MKQLFGFCALSFVVIVIITAIGVYMAAKEIGDGNYLTVIQEGLEELASDKEVELNRPEKLQLGLNFIRFFWSEDGNPDPLATTYVEPWSKPVVIFDDFDELGIQAFRQSVRGDLLWGVIEPEDDAWQFDRADEVIMNPDFEPIVTLFTMQYASGTPPWATTPEEFQTTLGPEAIDYLDTVIDRYGEYVTYWELGNEMDHWRAADSDVTDATNPAVVTASQTLPEYVGDQSFSPQQQGAFLAEVAEFIRERDDDAVIVMPGMGGMSDYAINTWFAGVIEGGGTDWFDMVNYHHYGSWKDYGAQRESLQLFLDTNGISERPVWLTETGSTASSTLISKTNYPNSELSQASDVWRRIVQAYGYGDDFVAWHTYVGSPDVPTNNWRLYGLKDAKAQPQLAYSAFARFAEELIPFTSVQRLASDPLGSNIYLVVTDDGNIKYVAWGSGSYVVPEGVSSIEVVGDALGPAVIIPGSTIELTDVPVLIK